MPSENLCISVYAVILYQTEPKRTEQCTIQISNRFSAAEWRFPVLIFSRIYLNSINAFPYIISSLSWLIVYTDVFRHIKWEITDINPVKKVKQSEISFYLIPVSSVSVSFRSCCFFDASDCSCRYISDDIPEIRIFYLIRFKYFSFRILFLLILLFWSFS